MLVEPIFRSVGASLFVLFFLLRFSFFHWAKLRFFPRFFFALVLTSLITHFYFSEIETTTN